MARLDWRLELDSHRTSQHSTQIAPLPFGAQKSRNRMQFRAYPFRSARQTSEAARPFRYRIVGTSHGLNLSTAPSWRRTEPILNGMHD